MATDHASSVQGVALRVCKLAPDGTPLVGTKTSFITSAFMRFGFTAEYTAGDEIEEKGADGSVCVYYQSPDILKRVTFSLAICDPSPELTEILIGGTLLLPQNGSDPVGYAAPQPGTDSTPNGVGFEVYSRAIVKGKPAAVNPFWRWVFPYAKMKLTGDRVMENGMMANEFEGWGVGNAEYGTGPAQDWLYTTDRPYQYARASAAPVGINNYVPVSAPPPADEVQTIVVGGGATGGTFTLTFDGQTTTAIAYNAATTAVQSALEALSNVGTGDLVVTGSPGNYTVTGAAAFEETNIPQITADPSGLTPTGTVTVNTTTQGHA